jgi:adenylylsulfate kinase
MVIWLTGLSASGKTTLSKAFEKMYKQTIPNLVLLDGDVIRQLYSNDLGYEEADRVTQIKRLQAIASFLEQQSIVVMVAALYANDELLKYNRENFKEYFEVYLRADVSFLREREIKELYKNALAGKTQNVVGVDIPWHEPRHSDMVFEASEKPVPEKMAEIIFNKVFNSTP